MNKQTLTDKQIHLWSTDLALPADVIETQYQGLSEAEQARADRFVFPHHRQRFIAAHGILRHILGCYLDVAPSSIVYQEGKHGKPSLLTPSSPLQFNLSHSHEKALIGLSLHDEIGVDIEHHRDIDIQGLANSQFSKIECDQLFAKPLAEQRQGFFEIWAQKEAFIKAIGLGLHCSLKSFSVSTEPAGGLLEIPAEYQQQAWFMQLLHRFPDYSIAVAWAGREKVVEFRI